MGEAKYRKAERAATAMARDAEKRAKAAMAEVNAALRAGDATRASLAASEASAALHRYAFERKQADGWRDLAGLAAKRKSSVVKIRLDGRAR